VIQRAHFEGRVGSIHEIRAQWLIRVADALGDATAMRDAQGGFVGRDFSGGTTRRWHPGLVSTEAHDGTVGPVENALWGERAYLVRVGTADGHRAPAVLGTKVEPEVLAALLSFDPNRPPGEDVVIVASGLGADRGEPARIVADRLGVRVWSTYGQVRFRELTDGSGAHVAVLRTPRRQEGPPGRWIPSEPGLSRPPGDAMFEGHEGTFPESDVISYPLPSADGRRLIGRAYFDPGDMADRATALWEVSEATHYVDVDEHIPGLRRRTAGTVPQPLPFPLSEAYVEFGHGNSGMVVLPRRSTGRSHQVRSRVVERLGRRSRSLQRLPRDWPVYLLYCDVGGLPPGADRLERVPVAQGRANNDNRLVVTSDGQTGPGRRADTPVLVKFDNPANPRYRWLVFAPEPGNERLTALADRAGLPEHVPYRAEWALRWVRAIRQDSDHTADTHAAHQQWFGELIDGFGAFERLRLAADPTAGPLSGRVLQPMLSAFVTEYGQALPEDMKPLEAMLRHVLAGGTVQVFAEPPAGSRDRAAVPVMRPPAPRHPDYFHSAFDPAEVFRDSGPTPREEVREQRPREGGQREPEPEQERGRPRHRTEPPARSRAADRNRTTADHWAVPARARVPAPARPASASTGRPAPAGLNLDAVPVGRTPTAQTEPPTPAEQSAPGTVTEPAAPTTSAELAPPQPGQRAAHPTRTEQPAETAPTEPTRAGTVPAEPAPARTAPAEAAPAEVARVDQAVVASVVPERARMLPITPRLVPYRFALDEGPGGLSAQELDTVQARLERADPAGEEAAARLGARVAAEIGARWAAEGLHPSRAALELHMAAPGRFAAAVVLARTVAETLRHRVHVTVGSLHAIEICPPEGGAA
jgi:hypothetical protein